MTAVQEPAAEREIGRERRRKEDQRLITGRTRWTDNLALPGMLHLAMVRSPFAHAKIVSIDTTEAKNATNVVDVVTGADLGEAQGACINAWAITEDQVTPPHLPMPVDRVAFAGEVVAVVVARSAAEARDAAELVDVEYDELPAALDLKHAATDEVLAHPDLGTNKSAFWKFDSAEAGTGGDVDAAIEKARTDGTRPASRSPSGRRPRCRTSCASRSRRRPVCRSRRSGSSPPTWAVASAASSSRPRRR